MAPRAPTTVSNDSRRPQRKAAPRMAKTKYKKNGLLGPLVIRLITVGQSRSVACTSPECRNCDFFRNQSVPIKAKEWAQYNNSKASIRLGYWNRVELYWKARTEVSANTTRAVERMRSVSIRSPALRCNASRRLRRPNKVDIPLRDCLQIIRSLFGPDNKEMKFIGDL